MNHGVFIMEEIITVTDHGGTSGNPGVTMDTTLICISGSPKYL